MWRLTAFCGLLLWPATAMAQDDEITSGKNTSGQDFWDDVQPTSRPIPWPEPVAFSYAAPAREAAQWWSSIKSEVKGPVDPATPLGTQALTVAQARQSQEAVREMARRHQDDPPLLLAWQAKGQSWRLHLSAIEAASTTRFLPQPQKWGVPKRELPKIDILPNQLIPMGSSNGMTPQGGEPLIIWRPTNALNWKMLYLLSHSTTRAFPSQMASDIHFKLTTVYEDRADRVEKIERRQDHLAGNVMHSDTYMTWPIPSFQSVMRQEHRSHEGPKASDDRKQNEYASKQHDYLWSAFGQAGWVKGRTKTLPARYSRILASLDIRYLSDQATQQKGVPVWMERGLQNLYSLDTADRVADRRRVDQWYPVLPLSVGPSNPAKVELLWGGRRSNSSPAVSANLYARGDTWASTPVDQATLWTDYYNDGLNASRDATKDFTGRTVAIRPLEEEAATQQMGFFFERFGNGAVVETLQRLSSGQSIDEALEETTGLNQAKFFAEWKKSRNKTE